MATAFYTVFSPEGEAPAKVQFATHGAAMYQACRLAKANPGKTFYVMRSCSKPLVHQGDAPAASGDDGEA